MKAGGDRWSDGARNANRVKERWETYRGKQELNWGNSTHFIVNPGLEVSPSLLPLHHLKYSPAYSGAAYVDCSVYAH